MLLMAAALAAEGHVASLYWRNNQGEGEARMATGSLAKITWRWCRDNMTHFMLASYVCACACVALVLSRLLPEVPYETTLVNATARRALKGATNDATATTAGSYTELSDNDAEGALWLLLALGLFLQVAACAPRPRPTHAPTRAALLLLHTPLVLLRRCCTF